MMMNEADPPLPAAAPEHGLGPGDTETLFVALLRGINVGGRNRVPMAELRAACTEVGWGEVRTHVQSGNLVLRAAATAAGVEGELERLVNARFGLVIPVMARSAADWAGLMRGNPFPEASRAEPQKVMLGLAKAPLRTGAVEALRERAAAGERVEAAGEGLWIHFPEGAGTSKLSPALLDRLAGSPVTLRNWRTVVALGEMTGAGAGDLSPPS
jgi:uncharacterized protein (DUF1697 family)